MAQDSTETRQGVVMLGKCELEVRAFSIPSPGYGEVRMKVKASTLCGEWIVLLKKSLV
jgi:D-arabinose 1-dehydrogenase-like Zn-dependent alcohol dehydrogenase